MSKRCLKFANDLLGSALKFVREVVEICSVKLLNERIAFGDYGAVLLARGFGGGGVFLLLRCLVSVDVIVNVAALFERQVHDGIIVSRSRARSVLNRCLLVFRPAYLDGVRRDFFAAFFAELFCPRLTASAAKLLRCFVLHSA